MREIWATFCYIKAENGTLLFAATGYFETEHEAIAACPRGQGVATIPVGEAMPAYVNELRRAYFPHLTTWAGSAHASAHRAAAAVADDFFARRAAQAGRRGE